MHPLSFTFTSILWMYQGKSAWHFVNLPKDAADEIRFFNASAKGFTPLKVTATIGSTTWKTAIFPDSKSGSFVLVVKRAVRKAENLKAGDGVTATVKVNSVV
jgi:Domain of unknown function (DUF1905)